MDETHPLTDAEELLDLLVEHRRVRISGMVRASAMARELDLPALNALQASIETAERALAHERRLALPLAEASLTRPLGESREAVGGLN